MSLIFAFKLFLSSARLDMVSVKFFEAVFCGLCFNKRRCLSPWWCGPGWSGLAQVLLLGPGARAGLSLSILTTVTSKKVSWVRQSCWVAWSQLGLKGFGAPEC